jgi:hypothetical protein
MHDTLNNNHNSLYSLRWLKFLKDPDHCPECAEWNVLIRKTENFEAGTPVSAFWRWECRECKTVWFDPSRVQGGYWARMMIEKPDTLTEPDK